MQQRHSPSNSSCQQSPQQPPQAGNSPQQQPPQQSPQRKDAAKLNLSFAGCGFLGIYHVGVASCFKEYAPQVSRGTISGSSAGALVAIAHICGNTQLGFATTDNLKVAMDARKRTLGPFHPNFDLNGIVGEALDRGLPDDAHVRASGVLHVSLTRCSDGQNVTISEFATRDELIQALLCSCFIPFFSGFVSPKLRGVAYVDGGFSNNLLRVDEHTVTVSPFCGEADICPQDDAFSSLLQINFAGTSIAVSPANMHRISNALLPAPPEVLKQLCQQGFDDGMRYLQRNKLISCDRCLNIRSPAKLNVDVAEIRELETLDSQRARFCAARQSSYLARRQRANLAASLSDSNYHYTNDDDDDDDDDDDHASTNTDTEDEQRSQCSSDCDSDFSSMGATSGEQLDADDDSGDDCDDCRRRRELALAETLPFMDELRDACDSVNKSLSAWLCSHWPIKCLSYLTAPYTLPLDLTLSAFVTLWHSLPTFRAVFVACLNKLINVLLDVVCSIEASSRASTTSRLWRSAAHTAVKMSPIGRNITSSLLSVKDAVNNTAVDLPPPPPPHRCTSTPARKLSSNDPQQQQQQPRRSHAFYQLFDESLSARRKHSTASATSASKPFVEIKLQEASDARKTAR